MSILPLLAPLSPLHHPHAHTLTNSNDWGYSFYEFVNICVKEKRVRDLVICATVYKDILDNDVVAVAFLEKELQKDAVVEDLKTVLLPFTDRYQIHSESKRAR